MPDEPPSDPITDHVIRVYCAADRCRSVIVGMGGAVPLPLSTENISAVVQAYGTPLPRQELDMAVFELDRLERS
ncbi:hypothetical protein D0C27_09510 [Alcaligenes faecalis]|nr:hypothetical protein BV899_07355 [Alcaligenes phenolicus]QCP82112.1 hypothetical protein D0C27_09510 [Alcaligenes faecalis]